MAEPADEPNGRAVADGPRRTNLLLLTDDFGGGTGNHVLQMMERWDRDRWRPEIVTGAPKTARVESPARVTHLPPEAVARYPLAQVLRLWRLRGIMRARRPRVVHAYFFWSVLFARLLKLAGLIPRLVENREDMGFGWGRHEYAWLRLTRAVPDRVICVSEAVRDVVVEREKLARDRTVVIRNGVAPPPDVDPAAVSGLRRRYGLPADAPVVGMVANLNREVKGGDVFLRVASRVAEEVPDVRFLVVGLGGLEGPLQREARRTGVASSICFTGYTDDVHAHYALMDVSVLTSRSEGLSITLLESMSHGLPIVATRVGGNPEVVVDGETGWLVPPDDIAAFSSRVVDLLRDPDQRDRLGSAGRRRAGREFDLDRVARAYEDVYDSLPPDVRPAAADGEGNPRAAGRPTS